jgi:hypothetical protein
MHRRTFSCRLWIAPDFVNQGSNTPLAAYSKSRQQPISRFKPLAVLLASSALTMLSALNVDAKVATTALTLILRASL